MHTRKQHEADKAIERAAEQFAWYLESGSQICLAITFIQLEYAVSHDASGFAQACKTAALGMLK